ncbi:MAG TPA: NAD(P)-binding domain-containing protein, partial [Acidimicrobiales bacterium]|nr:NAD(P)-binding domain-containing protein [Acidimicrobiales bacterium]
MTTILHESDADLAALSGQTVAVVGYGNQGRSWALNLRDAGVAVQVCVRADATRDEAVADGFEASDLAAAGDADVVCILVPDDAIPGLPLQPKGDALVVVASGYTVAFDRFTPACDVGMVAPRMLGPEVRRCYEEGIG